MLEMLARATAMSVSRMVCVMSSDNADVMMTGAATTVVYTKVSVIATAMTTMDVTDHTHTSVPHAAVTLTATSMDAVSVTTFGVEHHATSTKDTATVHALAVLDQPMMTVLAVLVWVL